MIRVSSFEFDLGDLAKFGDDLVEAGDKLAEKVKPVVARGAFNVKRSMQEDMRASTHFGQVARTITYDTRTGNGWIEAEVGPVTSGQVVGDLAHLAYFGGANGGGGTVRDPQNNLDEEAPRYEKAISDVLGDLL